MKTLMLDPKVHTKFEKKLGGSSVALNLAKIAQSQLSERLGGLGKLAEAKNPLITEEAHRLEVSKAGQRLIESASKEMASVCERYDSEIKRTELEMNQRLNLKESPLAPEIRNRLSTMSEDQRNEALGRAIKNGDSEILSAVLGKNEILTGVSTAQQDMLKQQFLNTHAKHEVEVLTALKGSKNKFIDSLTSLDATIKNAVDFDAAKKSEQAGAEYKNLSASV